MSADLYYHYKQALKSGYTKDEILDYFSESDPKINEAREAGYNPDEIIDFIVEKPSRARSLLSAFPKGAIKETGSQIRKTLSYLPEKLGLLKDGEDTGAINEEEAEEKIERAFPTRDEYAEESLERGGKIFPYAALGGTNVAAQGARSVLGGALGQGAEELGFGPLVQAAAETSPFLAPIGLAKSALQSSELVDAARKIGLSDKAITPLIQSEKKSRHLAKVSPRRGRTQKILDNTYDELGKARNALESSPVANAPIPPHVADAATNEMISLLEKMPEGLKKDVLVDFAKLTSQPMTGESLINFYKKLNYYIPKGFSQLGLLKQPIYTALESVSPELAQDFRLTNELFSKYYDISKKLSPTLVTDLFSAAGAVRILTGLGMGNYGILLETGLETGARLLAREMLLNPRFQNLGKKMFTAVSARDFKAADRFGEQLKKLAGEYDPSIAELIGEVDFKKALKK
jgi:hypothetical protein